MKSVFQTAEIAPPMNFARRASCCYLIKITPPQVAEGLFYGFILSLINPDRPVRAINIRRRHAVFPINVFRYGVPLCFCSVKSNAPKPGATREGILAYARHATAYCHAPKPGAIIEGIRRNCLYSIRDCNGCGKFIVYILLLVACAIFHQIV